MLCWCFPKLDYYYVLSQTLVLQAPYPPHLRTAASWCDWLDWNPGSAFSARWGEFCQNGSLERSFLSRVNLIYAWYDSIRIKAHILCILVLVLQQLPIGGNSCRNLSSNSYKASFVNHPFIPHCSKMASDSSSNLVSPFPLPKTNLAIFTAHESTSMCRSNSHRRVHSRSNLSAAHSPRRYESDAILRNLLVFVADGYFMRYTSGFKSC